MNNRHRRVARLKELERQRVFKKSQKAIRDFNQSLNWVSNAWDSVEVAVARALAKGLGNRNE